MSYSTVVLVLHTHPHPAIQKNVSCAIDILQSILYNKIEEYNYGNKFT